MVVEKEWGLLASEPVTSYQKRKNLIEEKSFAFALAIIEFYRMGVSIFLCNGPGN